MEITDVLIIGSGIAGLSTAIKIAKRFPTRRIVILTKGDGAESNTHYAQGGIAVVSNLSNDSFEAHIDDTLQAGDGLCDPEIVRKVVYEAPERLNELIQVGVNFDRNALGELCLGKEGGHHANRIVHCKDATGMNVSSALLNNIKSFPNITLLTNHFATDLITNNDIVRTEEQRSCYGAYVFDTENGAIEKYLASVTVLATGGIGQLYHITTNPLIATGDGIAMAYRAGAKVTNMEFVQFHPTALADFETSPAFLISEAVRGYGAYLRNEQDERFMLNYHEDGELACRDVVARAIAIEIQHSKGNAVYLDCRHVADKFPENFPLIYKKCISNNIDISLNSIPVAPAAHYLCGGIKVDVNAKSSIQNLYACGECSDTGLHGANRLASNSLLEALVFAHSCYLDISNCLEQISIPSKLISDKSGEASPSPDLPFSHMKRSLQNLMTEFVGIARTTKGLEHALNELRSMKERVSIDDATNVPSYEWHELRNMIDVALLIITQSLNRTENRGVFFSSDFEQEKSELGLIGF